MKAKWYFAIMATYMAMLVFILIIFSSQSGLEREFSDENIVKITPEFAIGQESGNGSPESLPNVYTYNSGTSTATITNNEGNVTFAEIKLVSNPNVYVVRGEDRLVAEFNITNMQNISDIFNALNFYDIADGNRHFTRGFQYKYKKYKTIRVDDLQRICDNNNLGNGTIIQYNCRFEEAGNHFEEQMDWKPLNHRAQLPSGVWEIGIFTDVKQNEHIEWIPTFYGVEITEWATWTESLNVDLIDYYAFEDGSGAVATGSLGKYDMDLTNTPAFVTGKIGDGINLSKGNSEWGNTSNISEVYGTKNWSVNVWTYLNTIDNVDPGAIFKIGRDDAGGGVQQECMLVDELDTAFGYWYLACPNNANAQANISSNNSVGQWMMMTAVYDGSDTYLYINNSLVAKQSNFINMTAGQLWIGKTVWNTYYDGIIDELGYWNRTLTEAEITQLYNGGAGITFSGDDLPSVVLDFPADEYGSTTSSMIFNATVSDNNEIINVSLYINDTLNQTNVSGLNNTVYTFNAEIPEGNWNWTIKAFDNATQEGDGGTRSFSVDTIAPVVNITTPLNTTYQTDFPDNPFLNITVNFTVVETNQDVCWYNWNGTNVTTACATAFNLTNVGYGQYDITVFANDTSGGLGLSNVVVTYGFKATIGNVTYSTPVLQGTSQEFSINFSIGSGFTPTQLNLSYDGVNYSTPFTVFNSTLYQATKSITVAQVDATTNKTFSFLIASSQGDLIETSDFNQTINLLGVDDCGTNTFRILNYTLLDEELQTILTLGSNGTINFDLQLFSPTNESFPPLNYSSTNSPVNNVSVCLDNDLTGGDTYSLSVSTYYTADNYAREYHNIQNYTLNSSTGANNISLNLLNESDATEFLITFKDATFTTIEDAIIDISRKYPGENIFRSIEIPKTDNTGQATASFDTNNIIYSIKIYKNGELLGDFEEVTVVCENLITNDCSLNLNALASTGDVTNWELLSGLAYDFYLNKDARNITFTFTTLDGSSKEVQMNVTKWDSYLNESICSTTLTSSSGSILCNVDGTYGNVTTQIKIFIDGDLKIIQFYNFQPDPEDAFGPEVYVLVFLVFLTIPFLAISSPVGVIVVSIVAVIFLVLINFLSAGGIIGTSSTIMYLIIAGGIIVWKMTTRE